MAVVLAAAQPSLAQGNDVPEKPVIAERTGLIEIEVYIDSRLRAYPGLSHNLMAEARGFRTRWTREARRGQKEDPDFFRDGRRWHADRIYSYRSETGRYVSILRSDRTYSGGAHGNLIIDTILWDVGKRRRVNVRPLFKETADNGPTMTALAHRARLAVAAAKIEASSDSQDKVSPETFLKKNGIITEGVRPALIGIGPISLAPSTVAGKSSGLTFHYQPYAVGAYAEGPYTVFVPWTAFQQYLSPEGMALFGGERPEKDKDDY